MYTTVNFKFLNVYYSKYKGSAYTTVNTKFLYVCYSKYEGYMYTTGNTHIPYVYYSKCKDYLCILQSSTCWIMWWNVIYATEAAAGVRNTILFFMLRSALNPIYAAARKH